MSQGFVYILKSIKNNRFYIGSTNNLDKRFQEHNLGKSKYTSESVPWEIVFQQQFDNLRIARQIEGMLKKLKNRSVLEKIITKGKLFLSTTNTINW